MHLVVVKPMGHGSCIISHGSVFVWVSGSWVDPLPALHSCIAPEKEKEIKLFTWLGSPIVLVFELTTEFHGNSLAKAIGA